MLPRSHANEPERVLGQLISTFPFLSHTRKVRQTSLEYVTAHAKLRRITGNFCLTLITVYTPIFNSIRRAIAHARFLLDREG